MNVPYLVWNSSSIEKNQPEIKISCRGITSGGYINILLFVKANQIQNQSPISPVEREKNKTESISQE